MGDSSRLEELRRRVRQDPASIAFAALAEEYRKTGHLAEAIETCRAGLQHYPTYILARVTLARALRESGNLDEAVVEFEGVVRMAPENLVAQRSLAEIYMARGEQERALPSLRIAAALAPQDADLRDALSVLEHSVTTSSSVPPPEPRGPTVDRAVPPGERTSDDEFARDAELRVRTLAALESLLAAIHRARDLRSRGLASR